MDNSRIILIGAVSLVRGDIRKVKDGLVMVEIASELNPILRDIKYIDSAPFNSVGLILRYGIQRDLVPEYQRIDRKHSELPISVELEMESLKQMSREEMKREFQIATLSALIDVAHRYGLPHEALERMLREIHDE